MFQEVLLPHTGESMKIRVSPDTKWLQNFSVRTVHILTTLGIKNRTDLERVTRKQILSTPNVGESTIPEIENYLGRKVD